LGLPPTKKKPEDNYEVLYGFDRQNKFIEKPLSQEDAVAILALMNGTEGTTIANGANLLIEYGNEKLFETDEQGTVIYSAFDRNPLKNGDYSLYITPENERKGIRLGVVDKDGKFAAAPGLEERKDLKKIVTKILEKQEIDLQPVKQNQPISKVTPQSVQQNSSPSPKVIPQPVKQNESPTAEPETNNQPTSEQSKPSPFPPLNQANAPGANPQPQPESTVKIPVSGGTQQPQSKPTVKVPVGGSQQPQPQEQRTR
jgi:hypothetical protein